MVVDGKYKMTMVCPEKYDLRVRVHLVQLCSQKAMDAYFPDEQIGSTDELELICW